MNALEVEKPISSPPLELETAEDVVVRVVPPAQRPRFISRLFGGGGKNLVAAAAADREAAWVVVRRTDDGGADVRPVSTDRDGASAAAGDGQLVRVCARSRRSTWAFAAVASDDHGHKWDLLIDCSWRVGGISEFLTTHALGFVSHAAPLSARLVESWVTNRLCPRVGDELRGRSIVDLRDRHALPAAWWEQRLREWLAGSGVGAAVVAVRWASAEAARAEEQRQRETALAEYERECDRVRAASVREAQADAAFLEEKHRIEHAKNLSHAQREVALERAGRALAKERFDAEQEMEMARQAAERRRLDHEIVMARGRNDLADAQNAIDRQAEANRVNREMSAEIAALREAVKRLLAEPELLLRKLLADDAAEAHQARERLTSPEFGLSAKALRSLGYDVPQQALVESLRASARRQDAASIRMAQLGMRDVGAARVKSMPLGTSLQFEIDAPREGFATVLNVGTSGKVWIHVPSAYVAPRAARVSAGRRYGVPGEPLMPFAELCRNGLDYVESGPAGWEHMAVVVSDEPLVTDAMLRDAVPNNPFVVASEEWLESFAAALASPQAERWAVGFVSFFVE